MGFKIGEKAEVIGCEYGHDIAIGDVVEILSFYNGHDDSDGYYVTGDWAVDDKELKPVK